MMRTFFIFLFCFCMHVDAGDLTYKDIGGKVCKPLKVSPDKKANVICFITVDCPIANGYSPRFNELAKNYAKHFEFIMVHVDWDTSKEMALKHKKDYSLSPRVLIDPDHKLVKKLDAKITPEAAVVLADGSIAYQGRIDNWYEGFGKKRNIVTKTELKDALDAIIAGKPIKVKRTTSVGCDIPDKD